MTQPTAWNNGTIKGTFLNDDFTPFVGVAEIAPAVAHLRVFDQANVLLTKSTVELDVNGEFEVTRPASVDPDISPNDWTYTVTIKGPGGAKTQFGPFTFKLAVDATVDLNTVTVVAPSSGIPNIVGGGGGGGVSSWNDLEDKPDVIAAGDDAATARAAIGAGTSSVTVDGSATGAARPVGVDVPWGEVSGKPATFTPSAHTTDPATIVGSTSFGQGLLSLASAGAMRTKAGITDLGSSLTTTDDAAVVRSTISAAGTSDLANSPIMVYESGGSYSVPSGSTRPVMFVGSANPGAALDPAKDLWLS